MKDNQNISKIRINLNTREIDVEGSEEFILNFSEKFENYLHLLQNERGVPGIAGTAANVPFQKEEKPKPGSFADYYQRLGSGAKQADKVMLAAYYAQLRSNNGTFKSIEVNRLLRARNVKFSNPAQYLYLAVKENKLEKLDRGFYKMRSEGTDYITSKLAIDKETAKQTETALN